MLWIDRVTACIYIKLIKDKPTLPGTKQDRTVVGINNLQSRVLGISLLLLLTGYSNEVGLNLLIY